MSFWQALILGFVQGVTEFVPVSSSGHLILLQNLLQIEVKAKVLFYVILHLGTMTAVFATFRTDILKMIYEGISMINDVANNLKALFRNQKNKEAHRYKKIVSNNYRKFLILILVSTLPTGLIGTMFEEMVNKSSNTLLGPGIGFLITGIMLLVVDYFPAGKKVPNDISYGIAFGIGVCQGFAVFPGISRAGVTIVLCLLCGMNRKFAVKYSFILSVPAVFGAMITELFRMPGLSVTPILFLQYLGAALVAAFVGYFCIRNMLLMVQRKKFFRFSVYCFLMGIISIVCNFVM